MKLASYKGTRKGFKGILNRLTRWWTNSIYSHNELVFDKVGTGWLCASSSSDEGVRFKIIELDPSKWDIIELNISEDRRKEAMLWFSLHIDQKYDYLGLFGFVGRRGIQDKNKWFCSEAIAASLKLNKPEEFSPGMLHSVLGDTYAK